MHKKQSEKVARLRIAHDQQLLAAIKQMDATAAKLLIVTEEGRFKSLLSIGDIQRAIIRGASLEERVENALRKKINVCSVADSRDSIKERMLHHRMEFMPILDESGDLASVIFWEDVFGHEVAVKKHKINLPVVIMAGGKGTRLYPITNIIPKPLIPLGDKPIIEVIVNSFVAQGVNQFFFSVNYKREMIERYFEEIPDKPYAIEYFNEPQPLGTAGSLHLLKGRFTSSFFVSNCDIIIDQDYYEIYHYHKENKNDLTIVGAFKHYPIPYGTLDVGEQGILKDLKEKPEVTFIVNTGLYILEPHLLEQIPANQFFHITELIEKIQGSGGRVGVFPVSEGAWMDVGEWKEYNNTMKRLGYNSISL